MGLNAGTLASDMLDLFKSMLQEGGRKSEDSEKKGEEKDVEYFARELAKIMVNHIKTATIQINTPISISTTVGAGTINAPVTIEKAIQ